MLQGSFCSVFDADALFLEFGFFSSLTWSKPGTEDSSLLCVPP